MILAQITDLHIDNKVPELSHIDARANALAVLDSLQEQNIQQLALTGDHAETHQGTEWFLEEVEQRGFQYRVILGNHDVLEPYLERNLSTPKPYFAEEMEGFKVFFLDSANYWVDEEQLIWLKEQLASTPLEILVFIHHPVLDCGETMMDKRYPLKNRDEVLRVLVESQREIGLFCGHYHMDMVIKHEKITQYVTPSTLYQLKKYSERPETDNENIGYRLVKLENGKYETEVKYLG
jgi:3',5'-cyclic-AMP phosphodiesterase